MELADPDEGALRAALPEADGLLVRTRTRVTADLLAAAPNLRVIGRGGVGLDNIDVEAARERDIVVVHTPAAATESVADHTLALLLALLRGTHAADAAIRAGAYAKGRNAFVTRELHSLTVGIIGLGRIGKAVARRCRHGFGCRVLYNDLVAPGYVDFVAESVSKERLYEEADVVTLHVPLTEATRRLIDAEALARFRRGALLINTARGAVVDAHAVADALQAGHLGGAAFDVLEEEPPAADDPLLSAPNVVLTPHIAARTAAALERMNDVVVDVLAVLRGHEPRWPA
jgi:phosphoglycerate dehydrogenase-like enzyme